MSVECLFSMTPLPVAPGQARLAAPAARCCRESSLGAELSPWSSAPKRRASRSFSFQLNLTV